MLCIERCIERCVERVAAVDWEVAIKLKLDSIYFNCRLHASASTFFWDTLCIYIYIQKKKTIYIVFTIVLFTKIASSEGGRWHGDVYIQRNLIKSNRNQIVFTIFWFVWNQTDVRFVSNQLENGKYNLISGWLSKIFLCAYRKFIFYSSAVRETRVSRYNGGKSRYTLNPSVAFSRDAAGAP